MRTQNFDMIASVMFESFSFVLFGYLFISPSILDITGSFFITSVFAWTAIALFNLIEFHGIKLFLSGFILVSLLFQICWLDNSSFVMISRNMTWFFLLAWSVFIAHFLLHKRIFQRSRFGSVLVWIIAFSIFYELMHLLDIYVFGLHLPESNLLLIDNFRDAYRIGSTIGFSIGLGYVLANWIIPKIESVPAINKYLKN